MFRFLIISIEQIRQRIDLNFSAINANLLQLVDKHYFDLRARKSGIFGLEFGRITSNSFLRTSSTMISVKRFPIEAKLRSNLHFQTSCTTDRQRNPADDSSRSKPLSFVPKGSSVWNSTLFYLSLRIFPVPKANGFNVSDFVWDNREFTRINICRPDTSVRWNFTTAGCTFTVFLQWYLSSQEGALRALFDRFPL